MEYTALIGDDNPQVANKLKQVLETQGFNVLTAKNGFEVMQKAQEHMPDIILLDIVMPFMDGFETCIELKKSNELKDIPVIMVTQKTDSNDLMNALELGAFDYIRKPIDEIEAWARIKSALKYRDANKKIQEMAVKDGLTGLYSHNKLMELFDRKYMKQMLDKSYISYVMLDLDHFKDVNDNYGHVFGDKVLREVAEIILNTIRISDVAGRYGGEEFGIIISDATPKGALMICNKLRNNIETHEFKQGDKSIHITASFGVYTTIPSQEMDFEKMVKFADEALYEGKNDGRNKVKVARGQC